MHTRPGQSGKFLSFLPLAGLLTLLLGAGCQTNSRPLPPVNLAEPGWTLRQGQAVWRSRRDAPELAGEILAASNTDGRALIQFTKTPLPLVCAQLTAEGGWQVELIPQKNLSTGQGVPPARLAWLQLARALNGLSVPPSVEFIRSQNGGWRLLNRDSGESVTGFFNP